MTTDAQPEFKPFLIGNYLLVEMTTSTGTLGRGLLATSWATMVCEVGDELHVIAGPDEHTSPRYICARILNSTVRVREFSALARALSGEDEEDKE